MKRFAGILSVIFVIALLWKDIAAFSWNIWFYNNQIELAAKYCVNKNKPMLHCDGKCYLARQLKKLEQEEKKNQPVPKLPLKVKQEWTSGPEIQLAFEQSSEACIQEETTPFFYQNSQLVSFSEAIFHPPAIG